MKRRSNTKKPHDPHSFYLDEGLSSPDIAKLMKDAGMSVFQYELLFARNQKIPDDVVIEKAHTSRLILTTKDEAMEREWIGTVIATKARMVLLTDGTGGITNLAAALICAHPAIERILLDTPDGPLIIKVNRSGDVTKIRGEVELQERWKHLFQAAMVRSKRHGTPAPRPIKAKKQSKDRSDYLPLLEAKEAKS